MDVDLDRKRLLSNDTPNPNGHRLFRATVVTLASFIALLLASSSASAATLNVSGGQLLGASGVDVGGTLYNVEFLDGACVALYSGCDSVSDFTFQTQAAALLATQALLDQVFLDGPSGDFDTFPDSTNGCGDLVECWAITPYLPQGFQVSTVFALNNSVEAGDLPAPVAGNIGFDLSLNNSAVYAVWSPAAPAAPAVPSLNPFAAGLLSAVLIALGVRNRREV